MTPSPRILIVRLSAIGDVIQTMPVACALRERFPDAFLAWAVEERAAELLRGHESLDELIPIPRGWMKSPKPVWRLRRLLRISALIVRHLAQFAPVALLAHELRTIAYLMCLAIPGKVLEITDLGFSRIAKVEFGGVMRQVSLDFVPETQPGDYVLVHVGFAISRVSPEEAERTYELLRQIQEADEIPPEEPL